MKKKGVRLVLLVLVLAELLGAGAVAIAARYKKPAATAVAPELRAPAGVRVRVQVLNSTKTRGLARRATSLLRDRGFDVVDVGTISPAKDTTIILDLSGHSDWAQRIAKVLAPAKIQQRTDTSRYLDIAVVLGSTWRPPSEPFYP